MLVTGTSAIVTGGASGLGAATAAALVDRGARVFAFDLAEAIETVKAVPGVDYVAVDVTEAEQVRDAVQVASGADAALRVVVNCAGVGPSMRILGRKGPHDLDFFAKVVQVNLIGTFNVMTLAAEKIALAPELEHGQRGVIVNTASVAAFDGQIGQAAYAASKGGIVGLRRQLLATWPPPGSSSTPSPPVWSTRRSTAAAPRSKRSRRSSSKGCSCRNGSASRRRSRR